MRPLLYIMRKSQKKITTAAPTLNLITKLSKEENSTHAELHRLITAKYTRSISSCIPVLKLSWKSHKGESIKEKNHLPSKSKIRAAEKWKWCYIKHRRCFCQYPQNRFWGGNCERYFGSIPCLPKNSRRINTGLRSFLPHQKFLSLFVLNSQQALWAQSRQINRVFFNFSQHLRVLWLETKKRKIGNDRLNPKRDWRGHIFIRKKNNSPEAKYRVQL